MKVGEAEWVGWVGEVGEVGSVREVRWVREGRLRPCGDGGQAKPPSTHQRQFAPGRGPQRGTRVGVQAVGPRRQWNKVTR
jgi:hypothetical protein